MGRPRRYATDAERQAAYRARQNGEPPPPNPEPTPPSDDGEEAYVAHELAVTRHLLDTGQLPDLDGHRLTRCEAYARQRWRDYHAGLVASL